MTLEEFKLFLPKYLSAESEEELYQNLKSYPNNIDKKLYSSFSLDSSILYQGDGISDLLVVSLPENIIKSAPAILLSNTCDVTPQNKRYISTRLIYAPIFSFNKYKDILLQEGLYNSENLENHLRAIKGQKVTQIFYLPKHSKIDESLVFFDRINNCPTDIVKKEEIEKRRLFSLSNTGFYVFLFKLSIHFTRVREGVDRN